jgi:hypothetical protein
VIASWKSTPTFSLALRRLRTKGWLGEVEGLKVSLAGAEQKLAQVDERARRNAVNLDIPAIG